MTAISFKLSESSAERLHEGKASILLTQLGGQGSASAELPATLNLTGDTVWAIEIMAPGHETRVQQVRVPATGTHTYNQLTLGPKIPPQPEPPNVYDSGARRISAIEGYPGAPQDMTLQRIASIVIFSLGRFNVTAANTGGTNLYRLPLGFRPPRTFQSVALFESSSSKAIPIQITPDGYIRLWWNDATGVISSSITYTTKDPIATSLPGTQA